MDLFNVVHMDDPRLVTIGVRPLGEGETPVLRSTEGRVEDLVVPGDEGSPPAIMVPPVQAVSPPVQQEPEVVRNPPSPVKFVIVDDSEEDVEEPPLVRKRARSEDGEGSSKRPRFETGEPSLSEAKMK